MNSVPPAVNGFQAHALDATAERALEVQLTRATELHGQVISEDHREVLRSVHYCYAYTARGITPGRVAWPLPVGVGKTQSVVAFAVASCERARPFSMLVCMNKVEALAKLKRDMLEAGVPAEKVGLLHTLKFDTRHVEACKAYRGPRGHSSEPSIHEQDAEHFPILLVTHKMLQSRMDQFAFNRYGEDGERDLVIWDESLLKSSGSHLDLALVREARDVAKGRLKGLRPDAGLKAAAHAAVNRLDYCLSLLDAELERQQKGGAPKLVSCPELQADQLTAHELALKELLVSGPSRLHREELLEIAEAFLRNVREPVRVVQVVEHGYTRGLIEFRPLIPDTLRRVVVLDASHTIRKLVQLDKTITAPAQVKAVKSFAALTASQLTHGGGRSTLDMALRKDEGKLVQEIVERLKSYPSHEGVLVFTYKPSEYDTREGRKGHAVIIQSAMREAGIDPAATLPNGKSRFAWLTWGNETGISDFSYCSTVLCVGVYRRSKLDLAAHIAGQVGSLQAVEAGHDETVSEVLLSEVFHALMQAAGRGSCRDTVSGQCSRMRLDWIGVENFPAEWWREALPDCRVEVWRPVVLTPRSKVNDVLGAMRGYLTQQDESVSYVSCRTLKLGSGLSSMKPNRFAEFRQKLAQIGVGEWRYHAARQGFVREVFAFGAA